jgi:hypothetical protein
MGWGGAGADGADEAAADLGGVGVGMAQELGEDEGGPLVVVERGDELVEGDVLGRVSNGGGRSGGGCCGGAGRSVAVGG